MPCPKEQRIDESLRGLYESDPTFCLRESLQVIAQQTQPPVRGHRFRLSHSTIFYLKERRDTYRTSNEGPTAGELRRDDGSQLPAWITLEQAQSEPAETLCSTS